MSLGSSLERGRAGMAISSNLFFWSRSQLGSCFVKDALLDYEQEAFYVQQNLKVIHLRTQQEPE